MHQLFALCAPLLLGVLVLLSQAQAALAQDVGPPLRCIHTPLPPFNIGQYGEQAQGISPDLCREIASRLGVPYHYALVPGAMLRPMLRANKADGICIVRKSPAREEELLYSEPVYLSREYLYYNRERMPDFALPSLSALAGMRVGLAAGLVYDDALLQALEALSVTPVRLESMAVLLRTLAAGGVDVAIISKGLATAVLEAEPFLQRFVTAWPAPVAESAMYIALARQSPAVGFMPRINEALQTMRQEGVLQRILSPLPEYELP